MTCYYNDNTLDLESILNVVESLFSSIPAKSCTSCSISTASDGSGYWTPSIKRVQFNGDTTIVWFNDGTRTVVKLSENDTYDRKTAIVYAIVKRMLGKVTSSGEVIGDGFGTTLQKIVDAGFDQQKFKSDQEELKKKAREEHAKCQEAAKKAAFERKVKARARELAIEQAAQKLVDAQKFSKNDPDIISTCKKSTTLNKLNSDWTSIADNFVGKNSKKSAETDEDTYVRPDKPFSQFTQEEKRAYWNHHNKLRRQKSK